jgi:hypothetical protein
MRPSSFFVVPTSSRTTPALKSTGVHRRLRVSRVRRPRFERGLALAERRMGGGELLLVSLGGQVRDQHPHRRPAVLR